jgi:hypothetical protein
MCAGNQLFTTTLALKLDTPFIQGWVYNFCPKPFIHRGFSKRIFKKQFFGWYCTKVVPFYSGFLASGCKTQKFFEILREGGSKTYKVSKTL